MGKKKSKNDNDSDKDNDNSQLFQKQAKILIIDDERLLRQSLEKILEKAGFYCETAYDYNSAKNSVKQLKFDLLLVDIILPKINGIELVAKLQEEKDFDSAVIFITGEPVLKTCISAIKLGAYAYLEKPVRRNELLSSIKETLIRKNYELKIKGAGKIKEISLNASIFSTNNKEISKKYFLKLDDSLDDIHNALLNLKNKYGKDFSEDQRYLLNIIAKSNSALKKTIKKIEEL